MASRSGLDRDRLTGRRRIGLPGLLLGAGVVVVAVGGVWFFGFGGSTGPEPDATSTIATVGETTTTTGPALTSTTTTPSETATTGVPETVASVPVLSEEEAYLREQARMAWLPGSQNAWLVDVKEGGAGIVADVPGGPRGGGAPARDGSLIVEIAGRVMRRTPEGAWLDISPAADRTYRIVEARTGLDHLHIYLIEREGTSGRLLNVMYRYDQPDQLEEKWVADGRGVTRVSASLGLQLVLAELEPVEAGGEPGFVLLAEETGRQTRRGSFPISDPGAAYVWGVEFVEDSLVFFMECRAGSFAECGSSDGYIADLSSGSRFPVQDLYPGWSLEWESPFGIPSFANAYGDRALLIRTNVDWADLQSGERERLIPARDL